MPKTTVPEHAKPMDANRAKQVELQNRAKAMQTPAGEEPTEGERNLAELVKMAGGKKGYFRYAFTIVPCPSGKMIPVLLEKVWASEAHVADERGIHRKLVPEHRRDALKRVLRAIQRRTMATYDGWLSPKKKARQGIW